MSSFPEPTLRDVLTAVDKLSTRFDGVDQRFDGVDTRLDDTNHRLDGVDTHLSGIDTHLSGIDGRLSCVEQSIHELTECHNDLHEAMGVFSNKVDKRFEGGDKRMGNMETRMVTKDYLDEKLFSLRTDLIQIAKRTDKRFEQLVEELVIEKSLKRSTADRLLAMDR